jgi:hypothetical protein
VSQEAANAANYTETSFMVDPVKIARQLKLVASTCASEPEYFNKYSSTSTNWQSNRHFDPSPINTSGNRESSSLRHIRYRSIGRQRIRFFGKCAWQNNLDRCSRAVFALD